MQTRYLPAIINGFIISVIYLFTQAHNLSVAHDSISYLNSIESDPLLTFHPHHLLYQLLAALVAKLDSLGMDAQFWVQSLNALFGGGVASVFFLLLRDRFHLPENFAHVAVIFPAFSYGIWAYSTVVEVYMIPLFFLMMTFYLLASNELSNRKMLLVGLFHGLAILFHQSHILFTPVVIWAIFIKADFRGLFIYLLACGILVASSYFIVMVGIMGFQSPDEMLNWLIGYGHDEQYWEETGLGMFFKSSVGLFRSIFGGHFLFALPFFDEMAGTSGYSLRDERFLVRNMSPIMAVLLAFATTIFSIFMGIGFYKSLKGRSNFSSSKKQLIQLIFIWTISYSAFFLFWVPVNPEFWLPQFVALSLLIISGWQRWLPARSLVFWLIPFAFLNYSGSMYWLGDSDNDYYQVKVKNMASLAKPEDLLLIGQAWILPAYTEKYLSSEKRLLPSNWQELPQWEIIQQEIYRVINGGNQVLVSAELWQANPSIWKGYESHSKIVASPTGSWLLISPLPDGN